MTAHVEPGPDGRLECLRGSPQLQAIARNSVPLALKLKGLLDLIEEADFIAADRLAEGISFDIHQMRRETKTTP